MTTTSTPRSPAASTVARGENAYKCYQCKKCSTGLPRGRLRRPAPGADHARRAARRRRGRRRQPLHLAVHRLRDVHHALPAGHRHRGHHGRAAHDRPRREAGSAPTRRSPTSSSSTTTRSGAGAGSTRSSCSPSTRLTRPIERSRRRGHGHPRCSSRARSTRCPPVRRPLADEAHGRRRRPHRPRQAGRSPGPWTCPTPPPPAERARRATEVRYEPRRLLPRLLAARHRQRARQLVQGHGRRRSASTCVEIPGWECCGNTAAHATNRLLATALPANELAKVKTTWARARGRALRGLLRPLHGRRNHEVERRRDGARRAPRSSAAPYTGGVERAQPRRLLPRRGRPRRAQGQGQPALRRPQGGCLLRLPAHPAAQGHAGRRPRVPDPHGRGRSRHSAASRSSGTTRPTAAAPRWRSASRPSSSSSCARSWPTPATAAPQAIACACPLCQVNLDSRQGDIKKADPGWQRDAGRLPEPVRRPRDRRRATPTLGLKKHMVPVEAALA